MLVGGVRLSPAVNILTGKADKRAMARFTCTLPYAVIVSTKNRGLLVIKVNDRPMCKLFCPLPVCGEIAQWVYKSINMFSSYKSLQWNVMNMTHIPNASGFFIWYANKQMFSPAKWNGWWHSRVWPPVPPRNFFDKWLLPLWETLNTLSRPLKMCSRSWPPAQLYGRETLRSGVMLWMQTHWSNYNPYINAF